MNHLIIIIMIIIKNHYTPKSIISYKKKNILEDDDQIVKLKTNIMWFFFMKKQILVFENSFLSKKKIIMKIDHFLHISAKIHGRKKWWMNDYRCVLSITGTPFILLSFVQFSDPQNKTKQNKTTIDNDKNKVFFFFPTL